jgi:hypothetical protein
MKRTEIKELTNKDEDDSFLKQVGENSTKEGRMRMQSE